MAEKPRVRIPAGRRVLPTAKQRTGGQSLSSPSGQGGWWPIVREPYTGAWQRNIEVRADLVLTYSAVYACLTLIASDIGKLRVRLVQQDGNGIWSETENSAFSPVLRKPNGFQNRIQFFESWITSKLVGGNTYVLKERDNRGVVVGLYILDWQRTKPLVAPDGSVFYQLQQDDLSGVAVGGVIVPAREIIHDRTNTLFHPLVGISPIYACGLAATQGLQIQNNSTRFFENGSRPSGILTTPSEINGEQAKIIKQQWEENYSGSNFGKTAVLGNDLKYQAITISAEDAQVIEQLKMTAETVCSCFHVPGYKVGIGTTPTYQNAEVLNQIYYSDCLQTLIESIELCLDEGLGLTDRKDGTLYGTEFDLDDLLRMDQVNLINSIAAGVKAGVMAPNEGRQKLSLKPVKGGESPYLQQQDFSLAALAERDQSEPFAKPTSPAAPSPMPAEPMMEDAAQQEAKGILLAHAVRELVLKAA